MDDTTLAMTMIWTAGELKYDGENEREGGFGGGFETFSKSNYLDSTLLWFRGLQTETLRIHLVEDGAILALNKY